MCSCRRHVNDLWVGDFAPQLYAMRADRISSDFVFLGENLVGEGRGEAISPGGLLDASSSACPLDPSKAQIIGPSCTIKPDHLVQ